MTENAVPYFLVFTLKSSYFFKLSFMFFTWIMSLAEGKENFYFFQVTECREKKEHNLKKVYHGKKETSCFLLSHGDAVR